MTLRGELAVARQEHGPVRRRRYPHPNSDMTASSSASQAFDVDAPIDYDSGASDLNPSYRIGVRAGNHRYGLYGSRALPSAVIITTKSGRTGKGTVGVTFNSSFTFERAGFWPISRPNTAPAAVTLTNIDGNATTNYWSVKADEAEGGIAANPRLLPHDSAPKIRRTDVYRYESRSWGNEGNTTNCLEIQRQLVQGHRGQMPITAASPSGGNGKAVRSASRCATPVLTGHPQHGLQSPGLSASRSSRNSTCHLQGRVTYYRKNSDNLLCPGYNPAAPLTRCWSPTVHRRGFRPPV